MPGGAGLLGWFGRFSLSVGAFMSAPVVASGVAVAVAVADVVVVESCYSLEGVTWLEVRLSGCDHSELFDSFSRLPRVVRYNGHLGAFVRRGWNSDKGTACYSTARPWEVARSV